MKKLLLKEIDLKTVHKYNLNLASIARNVMKLIFNYNFQLSTSVKYIYNNVPPTISNYYFSDTKFKQFIDEYSSYISTKYSKCTIAGQFSLFKKAIIPLKEKITNNSITRHDIIQHIQLIENNGSENIKSKAQYINANDLSSTTCNVIKLFNSIIESKIILACINIASIKKNEIKPKYKNITFTDRDYFKDNELDKIPDAYQDDRERLIFTVLLTTGLRIGGLLNIKVKNIFDEKLNVLSNGYTNEKGNKIRHFQIFPPLRQALEKYRDGIFKNVLNNADYALFPAYDRSSRSFAIGKTKNCDMHTINNLIHTVCKRVEINGDHVHAHAFRKTLITKLMSEGNTLDNVAKFIGHTSSFVTAKYYWTPTPEDLVKNMNMSWMIGHNTSLTSSSSSSGNTLQMQLITQHIVEEMKAKERFKHALSILTDEQILQMEKLWTDNTDNIVVSNVKNAISEIINTNLSNSITENSNLSICNDTDENI